MTLEDQRLHNDMKMVTQFYCCVARMSAKMSKDLHSLDIEFIIQYFFLKNRIFNLKIG